MAKSKLASSSVPNKALHCRVSYLHQAAGFLASQAVTGTCPNKDERSRTAAQSLETGSSLNEELTPIYAKISRNLAADCFAVSLKAQLRLSPSMKHTACKRCCAILIDGSTCANITENKSKGGKKPWADVLVRKCLQCGFEKRFPLSATRPKRKSQRRQIEVKQVDTPA